MSLHKIKVYAKLAFLLVVATAVVIFIASNREPVSVKFLWWRTPEFPLFWAIFIVANGGILIFLTVRRTRKIIIDVKQLRREERARRQLVAEVKRQSQPAPPDDDQPAAPDGSEKGNNA